MSEASKTERSKRGRNVGRALLVLTSLGLSLGIAEVAFRIHLASQAESEGGGDDGWYERYRHMNATIYRASLDEELVYEPTPTSRVEMEYGDAGFERHGIRAEHDVSDAPDASRTRIAFVGDSIVWSEYMAVTDALPQRTEEALGHAHYEVLNFGVSGYDTGQEALWYERAVRPMQPRIVVVVFCMNDFFVMSGPFERHAHGAQRARKDAQDVFFAEVAPIRRETIDGVAEQAEREATFRLLARAQGQFVRWRFESNYTDEYLVAFNEPAMRARVERGIARLGASIHADGARAMLVVSPILERWEDYRWSALSEFVAGEATRAGFEVIDPLDAWRAQGVDPEELRMGRDNLHYGRRGNRRLARVIADRIANQSAVR